MPKHHRALCHLGCGAHHEEQPESRGILQIMLSNCQTVDKKPNVANGQGCTGKICASHRQCFRQPQPLKQSGQATIEYLFALVLASLIVAGFIVVGPAGMGNVYNSIMRGVENYFYQSLYSLGSGGVGGGSDSDADSDSDSDSDNDNDNDNDEENDDEED